jgi:RHS repeat-associated protein
MTNRRGQHIDVAYDSLHRVISRTGSLHVKFGYLNHARVVIDSSSVTIDTSYRNAFGGSDSVKIAMAGQVYWRRYLYTPAGRLDSAQTSGGGITFVGRRYRYNVAAGVLDTIRLNGAATTIAFDNNYQPTATTLSGGDIISRQFTTWHNTMQITSSGAYNPTTERDLTFNPPNRLSEQDYAGGQTGVQYSYDGLSRLTMTATGFWTDTTNQTCMVDSTGGMHHCSQISYWTTTSADTFAYDAVGNRTDRGGTYTAGNRITQFDNCSYVTDSAGNVTSRAGSNCARGAATFTWNAEGSLATIVMGATTIALNYDAAGRLVRKDVNGSPDAYFLWEMGHLFAELGGSGTTKRAEYSYYPGMGRLHALIVGTTIYYAQSDGVGSIIALTDVNKNIQRTYSYANAWGTEATGSDNLPFNGVDRARWKGALLLVPELNLYYMGARWYEGGTGRFLSEDPLGLGGGINPVTYAGEDPINNQDPSGLKMDCRDSCGSGVWSQPSEYEQADAHADQMDADYGQWLAEAQKDLAAAIRYNAAQAIAAALNSIFSNASNYIPQAGDDIYLIGDDFVDEFIDGNGDAIATPVFYAPSEQHGPIWHLQSDGNHQLFGRTGFFLHEDFSGPEDAFRNPYDASWSGKMVVNYSLWYDVHADIWQSVGVFSGGVHIYVDGAVSPPQRRS